MKIDPNEPAFPVPFAAENSGMTYRQWLVGKIASGMVSHPDTIGQCDVSSAKFNITGTQFLAQSAIELADTIIATLNAEGAK